MTIERHVFSERSEWLAARMRDVTASDMGCLFGCHPYKTSLQLFIEKTSNGAIDDADSGVLRRGRILETAVARAVQEEKPAWVIEKADEYLRDCANRIGCTPDFFIRDTERRGVMQTKTVTRDVFKRHWGETPPLWVVLQNATEMMLTGCEWGVIAALIVDPFRLDLHIYDVPRNAAVERKIIDHVKKFWTTTDEGVMPSMDFERDAAALSLLYPHEVAEKRIDLSADNHLPALLEERALLGNTLSDANKRRDAIDAEIKSKLQDAEIGTLDGWRITWKTRAAYTANVKATRVLKVTKRSQQ